MLNGASLGEGEGMQYGGKDAGSIAYRNVATQPLASPSKIASDGEHPNFSPWLKDQT